MTPGRLLLAAALLAAAVFAGRAVAVVAVTLTSTADLVFGEIIAGGSAGSVTISPTGARTASGGVVLGRSSGAGPSTFTVTGEPDTSYGVTLPSSATLTGSAGSMTVDGFTSLPAGSGALGPGGTDSLSVGATLHVGSSQAGGSYSGTYFISVTYQ